MMPFPGCGGGGWGGGGGGGKGGGGKGGGGGGCFKQRWLGLISDLLEIFTLLFLWRKPTEEQKLRFFFLSSFSSYILKRFVNVR